MTVPSKKTALGPAALDSKLRDDVAAAIVGVLTRHCGGAHRNVLAAELHRTPRISRLLREDTLLDQVLEAYEANGTDDEDGLFHRPSGPTSHYWVLLPHVRIQIDETSDAKQRRRRSRPL